MPRQRTLHEMLPSSSPSNSPVKAKSRNRGRVGTQQEQRASGSSPSKPARRAKIVSRNRRRSPIASDDDEIELSSNDEDVRDIAFEAPKQLDPDSDSEPPVVISPKKRGAGRASQRPKPPDSRLTSPSPWPGIKGVDDDDDDDVPLTLKQPGKKRAVVDSDDESEESDRPKRRRLVRGKARDSSSENEDDMMDGLESERIIENRLRGPAKKSTFSTRLEALKQRRMGKTPEPEVVQVESEQESSEEDEDEEDGDRSGPFRNARPNGEDLPDIQPEEEFDDSFIVKDDEDDAPQVELPAQFSRQSHQDMSMHFKVVSQLFVHLAVQDEDDREEFMEHEGKREYFTLSLTALERKLGSLKDSLVRSSAWKQDFTTALNTYPEFEIHDLEYAIPGCDACYLGGRKSTFVGRVSGQPYSKVTFESKGSPRSDSEGSESSSESDSEPEREDDEKREFNLGRFCAARARTYHRYTHWQYLLFEALRKEVDVLLSRDGGKGSLRMFRGQGGVEKPKDPRDGDEVMKWLDDRGVIQAEWIKVKKLMEKAHHLDPQNDGDD